MNNELAAPISARVSSPSKLEGVRGSVPEAVSVHASEKVATLCVGNFSNYKQISQNNRSLVKPCVEFRRDMMKLYSQDDLERG